MKYLSQQNIVATSITPTFSGTAIDASQLIQVSLQAIITAGTAPTGSIKIQASNDVCTTGNTASFIPTNWTDIAGATVSYTGGGSVLIPKTDLSYRWIRIVNTFTSGSGTVAVNIFAVSV